MTTLLLLELKLYFLAGSTLAIFFISSYTTFILQMSGGSSVWKSAKNILFHSSPLGAEELGLSPIKRDDGGSNPSRRAKLPGVGS